MLIPIWWSRRSSRRKTVDVLVAALIVFSSVAIVLQTYGASRERQRSGGARGEATLAAITGLAALERVLINAGAGLMVRGDGSVGLPIGCRLNIGRRWLAVAPVQARASGDAKGSDELIVMAGASASVPAPVKAVALTGQATLPSGQPPSPFGQPSLRAGSTGLRLADGWGVELGDLLLIYDRGQVAGSATPCSLARVQHISRGPSPDRLAVSIDVSIDTPLIADYREAGVVDLGRTPSFVRISIDQQHQLVADDLLRAAPSRVLAQNVAGLRVQWGMDSNRDDVVDEWINVGPNSGWPAGKDGDPNLAKALRIGLLGRSVNDDRRTMAATCASRESAQWPLPARDGDASTELPAMPAGAPFEPVDPLSCVVYSALASVVPLRNVLMGDL